MTYTFPPNTYANRIGAIVTADDWTNPTESTLPILIASFTFQDGRTWGTGTLYDVSSGLGYPFLLYYRVRDWSDQVVPGDPNFVAQPLNPAVFPLCAQASNGGVGNVYSDLQTFFIPDTLRNTALQTVTFASHTTAFDSMHVTSAHGLVTGLTVWPQFAIASNDAQPVVRQSQQTGLPHGGYLHGSTIVGTRRATNVTACQVASLAMAYTYAGVPCTVDSLNAHLQRHRGYDPDPVAHITFVSPSGDVVRYTQTGATKLNVGDEFLVEHGYYTNPLASYTVTSGGRNGVAGRSASYSATIPALGDTGRVYWSLIPRVADSYTGGTLRTIDLPSSPHLAAQVESLLVRNVAVQLNVPGHFVVADGWTTSFRPDTSARGTYSIKDPYDPRNYTKLIQGTYRNTFSMARYVVPEAMLDAKRAQIASEVVGLDMIASGARRIEVVDPTGHHILRDADSGENTSDVSEASVEDLSSEHDNGGDVDDPLTGYAVHIPSAADGHYAVSVYSGDGLALNASGYDGSGVFNSAAVTDTTAGSAGNQYDVVLSSAGHSVTISQIGTLGVSGSREAIVHLRILSNPSLGLVQFALSVNGHRNLPSCGHRKFPTLGDQLTASVAAWTRPDLSLSLSR